MQTNANQCKPMQTNANQCKSMQTNADQCQLRQINFIKYRLMQTNAYQYKLTHFVANHCKLHRNLLNWYSLTCMFAMVNKSLHRLAQVYIGLHVLARAPPFLNKSDYHELLFSSTCGFPLDFLDHSFVLSILQSGLENFFGTQSINAPKLFFPKHSFSIVKSLRSIITNRNLVIEVSTSSLYDNWILWLCFWCEIVREIQDDFFHCNLFPIELLVLLFAHLSLLCLSWLIGRNDVIFFNGSNLGFGLRKWKLKV